jgi:hypothetical protein
MCLYLLVEQIFVPKTAGLLVDFTKKVPATPAIKKFWCEKTKKNKKKKKTKKPQKYAL